MDAIDRDFVIDEIVIRVDTNTKDKLPAGFRSEIEKLSDEALKSLESAFRNAEGV